MSTDAVDASTAEQDPVAGLARLWRGYARKVYGPDYPLYQALAAAVSDDLTVLEMILECRAEAHDPNMLLAAVQYLVLGGVRHPLADRYDGSVDTEGLAGLLHSFCVEHRAELTELMNTRHIQTNEIGRCGAIALGLATAATRVGQPIALVDGGTSAGLNLAIDEYLLDFGPAGSIGPTGSPLRLACEVRSGTPPIADSLPAIARRAGIDRAPVDVGDQDTARWLLACIWPGTGRQERARTAMGLAAGQAGWVRRGDIVDDLHQVIDEMRPHPTIVLTSVSYSYLPPRKRAAFVEILEAEGRKAPLAWVYFDLLGTSEMFQPDVAPPGDEGTPCVLGMAVFDSGTVDTQALAFAHPHGRWIRWLSAK